MVKTYMRKNHCDLRMKQGLSEGPWGEKLRNYWFDDHKRVDGRCEIEESTFPQRAMATIKQNLVQEILWCDYQTHTIDICGDPASLLNTHRLCVFSKPLAPGTACSGHPQRRMQYSTKAATAHSMRKGLCGGSGSEKIGVPVGFVIGKQNSSTLLLGHPGIDMLRVELALRLK